MLLFETVIIICFSPVPILPQSNDVNAFPVLSAHLQRRVRAGRGPEGLGRRKEAAKRGRQGEQGPQARQN